METKMRVNMKDFSQVVRLQRVAKRHGNCVSLIKNRGDIFLSIVHDNKRPLGYAGGVLYVLVQFLWDLRRRGPKVPFHAKLISEHGDTRLDFDGDRLAIVSNDWEFDHLSLILGSLFSSFDFLQSPSHIGEPLISLNEFIGNHMEKLWQDAGVANEK